MEKPDYRINYEMLLKMFPDRVAINTKEVATVIGCADSTVRAAIKRTRNPLPAQKIGKNMWAIPIPSFARWLSSQGV